MDDSWLNQLVLWWLPNGGLKFHHSLFIYSLAFFHKVFPYLSLKKKYQIRLMNSYFILIFTYFEALIVSDLANRCLLKLVAV